jgi:uncharacterized membrane protein YphA (DoxX/SURF4 family)
VRLGAASWLSHPAVGAACRLVLGGLFIYTATAKLLDPADFARFINGYRLLHPDLVNLAAITLPWIEFIAGALLVIGIWPESAALTLAGLLGMFLGAAFLAVVRGLEIECGCFLPFMGSERLDWTLFVRDAVLLAMALQVLAWPSSFLPVREEARTDERVPAGD